MARLCGGGRACQRRRVSSRRKRDRTDVGRDAKVVQRQKSLPGGLHFLYHQVPTCYSEHFFPNPQQPWPTTAWLTWPTPRPTTSTGARAFATQKPCRTPALTPLFAVTTTMVSRPRLRVRARANCPSRHPRGDAGECPLLGAPQRIARLTASAERRGSHAVVQGRHLPEWPSLQGQGCPGRRMRYIHP